MFHEDRAARQGRFFRLVPGWSVELPRRHRHYNQQVGISQTGPKQQKHLKWTEKKKRREKRRKESTALKVLLLAQSEGL